MKINHSSSKGPRWTKQGQSGQNRPQWTEQDQSGPNKTVVDKIKLIGPKQTDGPNRLKRTKLDRMD